MCNRGEPDTLFERFGGDWLIDKPRDNPVELDPPTRAYPVRDDDGKRGVEVRTWDFLHGAAGWPNHQVAQSESTEWRKFAENPANRRLIPLIEFCGWPPKRRSGRI